MTFDSRERAFSCDTCPEALDCDGREFIEAKKFAEERGWRTYKGPDGGWAQACPACVVDFARSKKQ